MVAKRFFYVCAGILCLALAYHLGARSATAQTGAQISGFTMFWAGEGCVMTPNGDVYYQYGFNGGPTYLGNFWSGAPAPAARGERRGAIAPHHQSTAPRPQER
jgi:hypothetical protein